MPKEKKTESVPKSENDNKDEIKTTPPAKKTVRRKRKAPSVSKTKEQDTLPEVFIDSKVQEKSQGRGCGDPQAHRGEKA